MSRIVLGFNCNCFTNRYDEPTQWARPCRATDSNIDLVDPYRPWDIQQ